MTEPTDSQVPGDPHEGIDAFGNREARAYEENQSSPLSRASGGGPPPTEAPPAGEMPDTSGGTSGGDPLAGVRVDSDEETVPGDEGPENPGARRNS
jgi:hypothetical protein